MARPPHLTSIKGFEAGLVESLLDEALALPQTLPVLGISGLQGSGKSTLARQLVAAGKKRGIIIAAISLDDFYLRRRERQALARTVHPLLATRGPPGTHDLALAHASLDGLIGMRRDDAMTLPRYDKLLDRRLAPSKWRRVVSRPRLIVFEGWCLGVPAEHETALLTPVNGLERDEDPDGRWRRYCNQGLGACQPLWQRIDHLLYLQPPDFDVVPRWRWQQECDLQCSRPKARGMGKAEVERFVQLFERISRQALRTLPYLAGRVLVLDETRRTKTSA